ncbi:MAG: Stp1/IreP family PP2C-type Ser/Thr phosphatase [Firmicutes bacterium]|nr:Stp1/IreP family PP2C-type Ser/Thr phosphatase [Bacillota bacterium]
MEVGFKTDKGMKRQNNEDACFVMLPEKVFLVADGVGGGNAGEIASRTAVSEIASYISNNPIKNAINKYAIVNYFQDAIEKANSKIYEMAVKYKENKGMATTLVAVYIKDGKAYIANVGDSRVYLFRDDEFLQLTEDHTYVNTLVKAGILTEAQAAVDSRKNIITKALGADVTVEPDFFQVDVSCGDVLILCTDGLYDEVSEEELIDVIDSEVSMSILCNQLIEIANTNGGHDNITLISLRVTEDDINE